MLIAILVFVILGQVNSRSYLYFLFAIMGVAVVFAVIRIVLLTRFYSKVKAHLNYLNESKYASRGRFWSIDECWTGFLICTHTPV